MNTYRAKEDPVWIKLDETKYVESTVQYLTQAEQKVFPATITDFARVFDYGKEPQVTSLGALPLGKYFQVALRNLSDSRL